MPFAQLGLTPELISNIEALGYKSPTPIQRSAIPTALARRDVVAIAQTGTGKTAAFALPVLQNLLKTPPKDPLAPRALILTPTRELALQVFADFGAYAKGTGLRGVVLHGGVSYGPQIQQLSAGVDVVVATPGRLRDHLQQKTLQLAATEILVLDEADRMLDMGFSDDLATIFGQMGKKRQTLLFSATFSPEIRALAQQYLVKPVSLEATPETVAAQTVKHTLHPVTPEKKLDLLFEVVHQNLMEQILVFARTKDRVDEVAKDLVSRGLVCMATHGDRTQAHRTKALARFKEGKIQILVATDIAARGLDTTNLNLVINYELPNLAEDYVHRIGRTGRAGKLGRAVSLVTASELFHLAPIEQLIKTKIPVVHMAGFASPKFDLAKAAPRAPGAGRQNRNRPQNKARWDAVRPARAGQSRRPAAARR